jgi:lysophospholipase L1-like esterase
MEVPPGALGSFFAALARVEDATPSSPALARIVHMGDSNVNRDQLPHYLRQALHRRFGDGGAGFVPIQPPTPEFTNRMVNYSVEGEWSACSILTRCDPYGHYGLGGVVARALPGSRTRIATRMSGPGRVASRIELWYGVEPGGGTLAVRVDRGPTRRITTDAPTVDDRWLSIDVAPGRHEVIVEGGTGSARAYGVVLESDGPGIVWDTLSMTGAFTKRVLEQDEAHFARQIHHRRPDLVIVQYGGNDLRRYLEGEVTAEGFEAEMRQLLARVRDARAEASCLLVGMGDHGKSGPMRVRPQHVEPLVEAQRRAAREAGCAFFDTYAAMGGRGSIHRWQRDGLASGDLVHLTAAGRRRMASTIHAALERGYDEHRAR